MGVLFADLCYETIQDRIRQSLMYNYLVFTFPFRTCYLRESVSLQVILSWNVSEPYQLESSDGLFNEAQISLHLLTHSLVFPIYLRNHYF